MGRIYVTGDIHAEPDRFNTENFPEQKELTRDDYMIICGDFGLVWAEDKESSASFLCIGFGFVSRCVKSFDSVGLDSSCMMHPESRKNLSPFLPSMQYLTFFVPVMR